MRSRKSLGQITRYLLLGVLLFGALAQAFPNTVRITLKNGDQLSGNIISTDAQQKTILLESPMLGLITIKQSDIDISTTPIALSTPPGPPRPKETKPAEKKADPQAATVAATEKTAPATPPVAPPPATSTPAAPQKTVAATEPKKESAPAAPAKTAVAPTKYPWKGKFEFGINRYTGRRELSSYYIRVDAEKKYESTKHTFYARYLYSEQTQIKNSDRLDATYRYRRDFPNTSQFVQLQTLFFYDGVTLIDQNYEQNLSLGHRLFQKPDHVVNITGGVTGQRRVYDQSDNVNALLLEIGQDYTYKISANFTFRQNLSFQYAPTGSSQRVFAGTTGTRDATNYKYRFNTSLQGKITKLLSLNLRFEYEYDNAILLEEARKDERIIATLGYAF